MPVNSPVRMLGRALVCATLGHRQLVRFPEGRGWHCRYCNDFVGTGGGKLPPLVPIAMPRGRIVKG